MKYSRFLKLDAPFTVTYYGRTKVIDPTSVEKIYGLKPGQVISSYNKHNNDHNEGVVLGIAFDEMSGRDQLYFAFTEWNDREGNIAPLYCGGVNNKEDLKKFDIKPIKTTISSITEKFMLFQNHPRIIPDRSASNNELFEKNIKNDIESESLAYAAITNNML